MENDLKEGMEKEEKHNADDKVSEFIPYYHILANQIFIEYISVGDWEY